MGSEMCIRDRFLFGLIGIHATGSISSFVISVLGACVCIWVDNRLFHDR